MSKVTSKLQLTIPKAVAEQYGIRPGDEVELAPGGSVIRMTPASPRRDDLTVAERVKVFRELLERFRNPRKAELRERRAKARVEAERGWKREDLYDRGSSR